MTWLQSTITLALKNRGLTLALTTVLLVAGGVAWRFLPLEAYPELADPLVRVITLYPGKGTEEVERAVTIPLEKELNGIPNQTALRSISLYGLSIITMTFRDGTPTTLARQQVLERINDADLPADAEPGLDADAGASVREVYRYTLQSDYYSPMGLRAIQQWELEKAFRQIPGVIAVISQGGPTKTYQVNVDPEGLRAHNLTLRAVFDALSQANFTSGGGFIEKNGQAFIVRELGLLTDTDDIGSVVIATPSDGLAVKVQDIASVTIVPKVRRGQVGLDKAEDVIEGIVWMRSGENPTRVLERLYAKLPEIQQNLPQGVKLVPLYDRADLVNHTLRTVGQNVAVGIALVTLVLGLFLFDVRAALITACVIPVAILTAFIGLNLLGVPANLLSLGALDFGILVDGAVVMTENIVRRLGQADPDLTRAQRRQVIETAAQEMARPLVFGVAVIILTFLPIFTFGGVEGKLFRPLALTMVLALAGSAVVALTLIPVLCSFFLVKTSSNPNHESPLIGWLRQGYRPLLGWSILHPGLISAGAGAAFVGAILLFTQLGSEFLPHLDEGNIWMRTTIKPGSVTLTDSVKVARQVRSILGAYPEVKQVLSQSGGPDDGTDPMRFADQEYYLDLKPSAEWRPEFHHQKEALIAQMQKDLKQVPGVDYYFSQYIQMMLDEALSGVQGSLVAKVAGSDLATLEKLGQQVGRLMKQTPGIVDVIIDPVLGQPQYTITIDRAQAARYGLNVGDLRDLVETAIAGKVATEILQGERRFDLTVRLDQSYRATQTALAQVLVDTPNGAKVPLSQVACLQEVNGATQIWREGGTRLATIRANVRGRDLASAVAAAQAKIAKQVVLPPGYRVIWSGEFERQQEAVTQLLLVLPLTIVVILGLLYGAFGSWRAALLVFAVVPLATVGGILALYVTGTYFSIAAGVGFIALFGVAVQNGILLVSYIKQLQQAGLTLEEAVYKGALARMRPVLMTATVAMLGLLPAALSNEIGAQTQKPFAIVIIGGLISATVLTLCVLPALYQRFTPPLPEAEVEALRQLQEVEV